MDDILIDENYDEIKEDFFKGLSRRQTFYGALSVIVGALLFYVFFAVLAFPQTAALYLAIACVLPLAANGFVRIYDMSIVDFLKLYRRTKGSRGLIYESEEYPGLEQPAGLELSDMCQGREGKKGNKKDREPMFLYLDTEGRICGMMEVKEGEIT